MMQIHLTNLGYFADPACSDVVDTSTTISGCCMAGGAYLLQNYEECTAQIDCSGMFSYLYKNFL